MGAEYTVLIVEDETALATVLGDKLTAEGFRVLQAADGEQGLEMAVSEKPDLILLDVILPKLNGIDMLKKLRTEPAGKKIPVMMLTNLSDSKNLGEALANGAYDFLVKSDWNIDDLVQNVRAKLAQKGVTR